jgi:cytochrome c oxidase assembly protein subunit 15
MNLPSRSELGFRHYLAGTTALTAVLMLLGVYTAAAGAGLTCAQRWPLCDGAVFGLFPADWMSFVEWFHRLVAMVAGFVILGATGHAWRAGLSRRVRGALTAATVLLPAQIVLGALTVTEYEWVILTAHFSTATIIYGGVALATGWAFADHVSGASARRATLAAAALLPAFLVLSPRLLFVYGATAQVGLYAVGLSALAALCWATVWGADRPAQATGVAAALVGGLLVLGRQVFTGEAQVAMVGGTLLAFYLAFAATQWHGREPEIGTATEGHGEPRRSRSEPSGTSSRSDD